MVCRTPASTGAAAVDPGNAVMTRQAFVDEGIVRVQQIDEAAIVANGAADKQLRFPLEGLQKTEIVVGIPLRIDHHILDAAQIQPLGGEIVDERVDGAM